MGEERMMVRRVFGKLLVVEGHVLVRGVLEWKHRRR
jgi:hypothetical protein